MAAEATPKSNRAVGIGGQYGYYTDTETGLVLMTHRYYDAGKGRFINRDPIGAAGGINLYGFVGNNPVTGADPEGTDRLDDASLAANTAGFVPILGIPADLTSAGISAKQHDWFGVGLSLVGMVPLLGDATDGIKEVRGGVKVVRALKDSGEAAELARAGEDLFVGTYDAAYGALRRAGHTGELTAHHVVQDAGSEVSHGKGITISLRKAIHEATETFRRPKRMLSTMRQYLAADISELRRLLRENGYSREVVNRQLRELIRQNKALGGFEK